MSVMSLFGNKPRTPIDVATAIAAKIDNGLNTAVDELRHTKTVWMCAWLLSCRDSMLMRFYATEMV